MNNRKVLIALILTALLAFVIAGFAVKYFVSMIDTNTPGVDPTFTVRYRVLASSPMLQVTLMNTQGGIQQFNVDYPESKDKSWSFIMEAGSPASISVQDLIGYGQTVTCQIFVDSILWKTSTSHGNFVTASCSGIIGSK